MAEYIEREALRDSVESIDWYSVRRGELTTGAESSENALYKANDIYSAIDNAPAANVAPVRHGLWIHSRYKDCSEQFELVKCSQCNHEAYAMAFYVRGGNYCPNCGAKMDGEP